MLAQAAIQAAICRLGLTEYKLATSAGIDRALLHRALRGERPLSPDMIDKIAAVLGLDADQLKAWADVDRLGEEGLDRLKRYVIENPPPGPNPDALIELARQVAASPDLRDKAIALLLQLREADKARGREHTGPDGD